MSKLINDIGELKSAIKHVLGEGRGAILLHAEFLLNRIVNVMSLWQEDVARLEHENAKLQAKIERALAIPAEVSVTFHEHLSYREEGYNAARDEFREILGGEE